jgi:hypothetical protein
VDCGALKTYGEPRFCRDAEDGPIHCWNAGDQSPALQTAGKRSQPH